jgi:hypothetical protein
MKLVALGLLLIALLAAHDVDHYLRGDFSGATAASWAFVGAQLFAIAGALLLYLKKMIGPLWFSIGGGAGAALLWLAHLSPFSDQTPQTIYDAYQTRAAGLAAEILLYAIMLTLLAIAFYGEYLWARGLDARRRTGPSP